MQGEAGRASVLTALAILVIGPILALYGAVIAAATLDFRLAQEARAAPTASVMGYDEAVWRTRLWVEIPGAQGPAHDLRLEAAGAGSDLDEPALQRLALGLEAHLAVEPISPLSWIRLARVRALLERPMAEVEQAFLMSGLTGRFDEPSMAERAFLVLALWTDLSEDLRRQVRSELRTLAPMLRQQLREAAERLPEATRTELEALFQDTGL
jgi:hypothetical protein